MTFRLIRGERIAAYLTEVSTTPQLQNNISSAFPNTRKRQHATNEVSIQNIEYIPYLGTKYLHVRSTSNSNGHQYQQALQFMRVNFEGSDTPDNVTFLATDKQEYHMQPIALHSHNVKVRCSCLDFYFRFATWNSTDKSLVGRPPAPYIRKTNDRPEVNPDHVPGMCKHLLKLVQMLRNNKLVQ